MLELASRSVVLGGSPACETHVPRASSDTVAHIVISKVEIFVFLHTRDFNVLTAEGSLLGRPSAEHVSIFFRVVVALGRKLLPKYARFLEVAKDSALSSTFLQPR